ncbi:hypothetical protein Q5424_00305 [Conexibacter sp. JD483]|uniref:hypothetical protein n=1 Tax=unclassified Conexibacter TaxID=2627773 RepID=UPI002716B88B|nr:MULTISPECIES: hypothetical protein [unclassified Conexibacter]MDO8184194.1 hypothetical protein [Conexibacter sp. CPCC 205706]MDO8197186.1 hypothetical protein [Conexibacter sp. CPCC 205762]MDR9367499.1 hypothetical protein [Conexibacter sp. JD483]
MRIASIIRPESGNANYRARFPLVALQSRGHEHQLFDAHRLPHLNEFARFDVVHFCRLWEEPFQLLARALRDAGVGVTWDCDDYLPAIPKETSSYRIVGGPRALQVARDMQVMMDLAHIVTTPSPGLLERFADSADDVRLIENYIAPPMVRTRRPQRFNDYLHVGWVAGNEHRADVEPLRLRALVERLLEFYPRVEFVSLGLGLGIRHARYVHLPGTDVLELTRFTGQLDIAIAPLDDTEFNQGRSNVKVKEYAAGGAAWLASDVAPYRGLGTAEGGKVIANDRWEREITALIGDTARRRALAANAFTWGARQNIMLHLHEWEEAFGDAVARGAAGDGNTASRLERSV